MTINSKPRHDRRGSGFHAFATRAEITVLKTRSPVRVSTQPTQFHRRRGVFRPQFQNMTGNDGANGYKRNGF